MSMSLVRVLALGATILAFGACERPAQAADIDVILDEARLVKLPDRVATLVIGNPVIADASVQSGGWIVVTGKSFGMTNIIALDRSGAVLMEKTVEVRGPREVVVVYKGVDRETYSCTPECERRVTLGDAQPFFEATTGQIKERNSLAVGATQAR